MPNRKVLLSPETLEPSQCPGTPTPFLTKRLKALTGSVALTSQSAPARGQAGDCSSCQVWLRGTSPEAAPNAPGQPWPHCHLGTVPRATAAPCM